MNLVLTENKSCIRLIMSLLLSAYLVLSTNHLYATTLAKGAIKPTSCSEIQQLFHSMDYHWETLHQGVPEITLDCFPADITQIHNVEQKKQLFYMSLLPMVISQNNKILQQRTQLQQLLQHYDKVGSLTDQQKHRLSQLGDQYRCQIAPLNSKSVREELLRRINIVPTALVIAQAANESAYGSSRFAQLANNIFGEWTFKVGTGLVPLKRSAGKKYEVKKFDTLSESLGSYLNNLNTHRAYQKLREDRFQMSQAGIPLDAQKLAEGLINYSTRRAAYVAEIQSMIRYNKLAKLDGVELRSNTTTVAQLAQPHIEKIPGQVLRLSQQCSRIRAKQQII